jgi:hypothetical protein
MNGRHVFPLLITTFASIVAVVTTTGHDLWHTSEEQHHHAAAIEHHHDAAPKVVLDQHTALADMTAHAVRHYGAATLLRETYAEDSNWLPEWTLASVDAVVNGHMVQLYHATYRPNAGIRFTSASAPEGSGWTAWEIEP